MLKVLPEQTLQSPHGYPLGFCLKLRPRYLTSDVDDVEFHGRPTVLDLPQRIQLG